MKNLLEGILIFTITLTIGFGFGEAVLRLRNSNQQNYNIEMWRYARTLKKRSKLETLGHEHVPNASAQLQGVQIRLNSFGMRGPEPDLKDTEKKRILILGSSNTLGWGVKEEDTMAAVLQKELGETAQVFNGGIGNYNAVRYVTLLKEKLLILKPDIVVVHYFVNDAEKLSAGGGNMLLRHSELAVILYRAFENVFRPTGYKALIEYYKKVYQKGSAGRSEMEAAFRELDAMSKTYHFKVIFTMVPDIHALNPYPFRFVHDLMRQIATSHGWVYVDFTDVLRSVPAESLWAMPGDPHLNALGHKLMAYTLLPYLKIAA